jgi:hypothetical protein
VTTATSTAHRTDLAAGLVRAHRDLTDAATAPARVRAAAYLDGMTDAAHRLGIGMTPTAVRVAVADTVRAAGPRPGFAATSRASGDAVRAWDGATAADLALRLAALD